MATLSFSCPKCNRAHDRVRPEMIGHKVKCKCGFVFRIGLKSSKRVNFPDELTRIKNRKSPNANAQIEPGSLDDSANVCDAGIIDVSEFDSESIELLPGPNIRVSTPNDTDGLLGSDDNTLLNMEQIFDSEQSGSRLSGSDITQSVGDNILKYPLLGDDDTTSESLANVRSAGASLHSSPAESSEFESTNRAENESQAGATRDPRPRRHSQKGNRTGVPHASPKRAARATWTLILFLVGIPIVIASSGIYLAPTYSSLYTENPLILSNDQIVDLGNKTATVVDFIMNLGMGLLFLMLTVSMIAVVVVSMIERLNQNFVGWPIKLAASLGGIIVVAIFIEYSLYVVKLFTVLESTHQWQPNFDKALLVRHLAVVGLIHVAYAVVPLAIMVTGVWRNRKR